MSPLEFLVWAVTGAVIATAIGNWRKGRPLTGFLLGLFLGWIGVIIIALMPPTREKRVQRERERLEIEREARGS
jgi:hypothetical protein